MLMLQCCVISDTHIVLATGSDCKIEANTAFEIVNDCVCRLDIRLHHRHAGNMLCAKLVNQQNLMEERQDNHANPNIDVNFIACQGRLVTLPDQVELTYR